MAKGKIAINVEYGALRTFCALLNALPYPLAMALARGFGWLLVRVFRFKRRRTFERIRGVFPEMDEAIERIRGIAAGWKITGAGGGGYLVALSDQPVENAIQVRACRC